MSEFQKLDFSLVWYSFLALMQEKNQKKIKPPCRGRGSLAWYMFRGAYAFASFYISIC